MTDEDLRMWSRSVFPFLRGMSHAQVCRNRREWVKAVRHLGPKWRTSLRDVRTHRINPLNVVNGR
jgi:hypothetical protein